MDRRALTERALRGPLDDREWQYLVQNNYTDATDWEAGGAESAAQAVKEGRRAFGSGRRPAHHFERPPEGWQRERVRLLARLYGQLAEAGPSVRYLRAKLDAYGVPATLTKSAKIDAAGVVSGSSDEAALVAWIRDRYRCDLGLERGADEEAVSGALDRHLWSGGQLTELWFSEGGGPRVLSVRARSLLGEVAKVAAELSDRYHWSCWDATRWVVCSGDPPTPWVFGWGPQLHLGETDTTTRLEMEVDPTLTPAEVAAAYGRARAAIFRGARVRPLDDKARALVRFALDQGRAKGEPPWEEWRRCWNAGPGRKHGTYRGDGGGPWNFRRDLRSAWRRLTQVGWVPPGFA